MLRKERQKEDIIARGILLNSTFIPNSISYEKLEINLEYCSKQRHSNSRVIVIKFVNRNYLEAALRVNEMVNEI